jgi:hypothetical protein
MTSNGLGLWVFYQPGLYIQPHIFPPPTLMFDLIVQKKTKLHCTKITHLCSYFTALKLHCQLSNYQYVHCKKLFHRTCLMEMTFFVVSSTLKNVCICIAQWFMWIRMWQGRERLNGKPLYVLVEYFDIWGLIRPIQSSCGFGRWLI